LEQAAQQPMPAARKRRALERAANGRDQMLYCAMKKFHGDMPNLTRNLRSSSAQWSSLCFTTFGSMELCIYLCYVD